MNVRTITIYNLVDSKGSHLQLRLGYIRDKRHSHENAGWRWSFEGTKIPMPIRSNTWFNGFPEKTMLDWLAKHNWFVRTKVDMASGKTVVYDLPKPKEEEEELYFITTDDDSPNAYVRSDMETAILLRNVLNTNDRGCVFHVYKGTEV